MTQEEKSSSSSREGTVPTGQDDEAQLSPGRSSSIELVQSKTKSLLAALSTHVDGRKRSRCPDMGEEPGTGGGSDAGASGSCDGSSESTALQDGPTPPWSWKHFLLFCGPGLLMSVAYLDPGNLEADIQAGAKTGFALLWWFLLVSMGCGSAFQLLSGKIGLATGKDLARYCGEQWPFGARWFLWVMLEFAIVAVDIQETVGCAQALYMLSNSQLPLWAGCIVVSCSAFLLLLLERHGARWLEALFGMVIGMEAVAMAVNFFRAGVPAKEVALGIFRPTLPANAIVPAVGALGALVMPYNLYFSSAVVMSRRPTPATPGRVREVLRYHRLETPLVLLGTFCINMFVICVFATGFYGTDQEIGLQAAGDLLGERFGKGFKLFWALGLLAAGQVSTIALTYAGQLIMAGLLRMEVKGWSRMIGTRLFALVPALTVALVSNTSNKFDSLNQMLNVVQSIQLPFALIPAIHIAANRKIMGTIFATSKWLNVFCSLISLAVASVNGYFLVIFRQEHLPGGAGVSVGWAFLVAAYYCALAYYAVGPDRMERWAAPRLRQAHTSMSSAGSATARAAGGLVTWVKGINWRDPESLLEIHL